ncbi:MAG: tetratricopeptide repeat protein [Nannocystales bacterium]
MRGCLDEDRLLARVERRASPQEIDVQDAHIAQCSLCREVLAEVVRGNTLPAGPFTEVSAIGPGHRLGRYLVRRKLGAGGMGSVYAAFDPKLRRLVAIKSRHLELNASADARSKILDEARAMARVQSAHVVDVFEVITADDEVHIVMEAVDGVSLGAWLTRRGSARDQTLNLLIQAGRGLADAHACGVVHRDFKPANVLVRDPDALHPTALVADFGLSTVREPVRVPTIDPGTKTGLQVPTEPTVLRGTPRYLAPELFEGGRASAKTDQFAFCVSAYQALWRSEPFPTGELLALRDAVLTQNPCPPPKHAKHRALWSILRKGMARLAEDRWPSMAELCDALTKASAPQRGIRGPLLACGVAVLAVLGAQAGASTAPLPCEGVDSRMEEVWSPERRAEVEKALASTDTPMARHSASEFSGHISDYVSDWTTRRIAVCEDARSRGPGPAKAASRLRCLQRGLSAVEAAATTAMAPDTVTRAIDLAVDLPPLSECDPLVFPASGRSRWKDEGTSSVVLEGHLARAQALRKAGRFEGAYAAAQDAVQLAHEHDDVAGEARGLQLRGRIARTLHGKEVARDSLLQALLLFRGLADRRNAARTEALLSLAAVGSDRQVWAELALKDSEGLDDDPLRAEAMLVAGAARFAQADILGAQEFYERALAQLGSRAGESPLLQARVFLRLGSVNHQLGEPHLAAERYRAALKLHTQVYGPGHPRVALDAITLGDLLLHMPKFEEASTLLAGVLEQCRINNHSPRVLADVLVTLGDLETRLDRLDSARALLTESIELAEQHPRVRRRTLSDGLLMLSQIHTVEGNPEAALPLREQAIDILHELVGPDDPLSAAAEVALGWTLYELGRFEDAARLGQHALDIFEEDDGHAMLMPWTHDLLGVVASKQGEPERAIEHYQHSLELTDSMHSTDSVATLHTLMNLVRAQRLVGSQSEARATLERAVQLRSRNPADISPLLSRELDELLEPGHKR